MRANIEAIRVLKLIEEEGREATAEEKKALVKYVGWGAFAQALFDANPHSRNAETWKAERQALGDLLTTAEWDSARASTTNAHYTSEAVIRGIWSALDHLGFEGGRALEPAAGVGHFIGLTPERLRDDTAWTAVELDQISGRIAKTLYGGADIRVQGFETVTWPNGFFDLAVGNVPFGNYALHDPSYKRMSIHDYFFVKSLDKLRPGGVAAMVTSSYTLDKQSAMARREMARRADFLGAVRLPGGDKGAFAANARTEVTTDIIFLRKRGDGEPLGDQSWLDIAEISTPDGPVAVNAYYAANPQMMLGEMRLQGTMRGANEPVLIGAVDNIEERIAAAARTMPANAFTARQARIGAPQPEPDAEPNAVKEGAFYLKDGQLYRKVLGVGQAQEVSKSDLQKVSALIGVRDIVNELLARQARGEAEHGDDLRAALNTAYDSFVAQHGAINRTTVTTTTRMRQDGTQVVIRKMPNLAAFRADPDAMKVAAIENYTPATGAAAKAAIFFTDIVAAAYTEPEITGPSDALAVSLNRSGQVDMAFIAERLDLTEDEAAAALGDQVYLDPAGDVWRTRDDYLSGDVVHKLDDAQAAAASDRRYKRNVAALEAVQPIPLTRVDINVLFGAPWVPAEVYQTFCREALSIDVKLSLNPVTKRWQLPNKPVAPESAQAQFGTKRSTVIEVLEAALNSTEIRITDPNPDGAPIYNPEASEESNAKVKALRDLFSGAPEAGVEAWVWQDEERAAEIETLYNQRFNRIVPTVYDGSHQTFPGLARVIMTSEGRIAPFALRPHQASAVWRTVKSGNALFDHVVGAGKTELRRDCRRRFCLSHAARGSSFILA